MLFALLIICSMAISPAFADYLVYHDCYKGTIYKIDLATMKKSTVVKVFGFIDSIGQSSGGDVVYSAYDGNRCFISFIDKNGKNFDDIEGSTPTCSPKNRDTVAYYSLIDTAIKIMEHRHQRTMITDIEENPKILGTPVVKGISDVRNISWSPDGTKIAYEYSKSKVSHLATYDIKTKKITQLGEGKSPTWTPDGKSIIYEDWKLINESEAATKSVKLDLSIKKRTLFLKDASNIQYLSDGKTVACVKELPNSADSGIYLYDTTTKKFKLVAPNAGPYTICTK